MLYFDVVVRTGEPSILKEVRKWCQAKRIAQRVTEASPTLAYIVINLDERFKTEHLSHWVVTGGGGDRQLRRVQSGPEKSRIDRMFLPPQIQVSS